MDVIDFYMPLPVLVWEKIIDKLDDESFTNLAIVYQNTPQIMTGKKIRSINLGKKYSVLHLNVAQGPSFTNITILNINCLYWLNEYLLRLFLMQSPQLKELYAIDTVLSLTSVDKEYYRESNITKLAISMQRRGIGRLKRDKIIGQIHTLYIKMDGRTEAVLKGIDKIFPNLRKLWIDVERSEVSVPRGRLLRKFFCESWAPDMTYNSIDYLGYRGRTYYGSKRHAQPFILCTDYLTFPNISFFAGSNWIRLLDFLPTAPEGPKDRLRMLLQVGTHNDVLRKELNFHHESKRCYIQSIEAVTGILSSYAATQVEKLCIMTCCIKCMEPQQIQVHLVKTLLEDDKPCFVQNYQMLKHLELYICNTSIGLHAVQGYSLISNYGNLESLTLEILPESDGEFLIQVADACPKLSTLRITYLRNNKTFYANVCTAVSRAAYLKDFRYESPAIDLEALLQCLSETHHFQLQRLVVICRETNVLSAEILRTFLRQNRQLIFLYIITAQVQPIIFIENESPKRYFVNIDDTNFTRTAHDPIPNVHYFEMVEMYNYVSTLCVFDEFQSF